MHKPRICVTIIENNLKSVKEIEPEIDLIEVRLDLLGPDWPELVKSLEKPWIACNRSPAEGGRGSENDAERIKELLKAAAAGASIVDIEYRTPDLSGIVLLIKEKAQCLLSYHDFVQTPSYDTLVEIASGQIRAGADICKIVTTAQSLEDNITVLKLINRFPEIRMVAFAMSETGRISRILSPLAGGYFTYACIEAGRESAAGQIPVKELNELYRNLRNR
jgi:3-dehydroquinate dehydratase type I